MLTPLFCPARGGVFFASPFDESGPSELAKTAAEHLQAELRAGDIAEEVPAALLFSPAGGKMFGVLVVQKSNGEVGYLRASSPGMLAGRWQIEGYAPPMFDAAAREAVEIPSLVKRESRV